MSELGYLSKAFPCGPDEKASGPRFAGLLSDQVCCARKFPSVCSRS